MAACALAAATDAIDSDPRLAGAGAPGVALGDERSAAEPREPARGGKAARRAAADGAARPAPPPVVGRRGPELPRVSSAGSIAASMPANDSGGASGPGSTAGTVTHAVAAEAEAVRGCGGGVTGASESAGAVSEVKTSDPRCETRQQAIRAVGRGPHGSQAPTAAKDAPLLSSNSERIASTPRNHTTSSVASPTTRDGSSTGSSTDQCDAGGIADGSPVPDALQQPNGAGRDRCGCSDSGSTIGVIILIFVVLAAGGIVATRALVGQASEQAHRTSISEAQAAAQLLATDLEVALADQLAQLSTMGAVLSTGAGGIVDQWQRVSAAFLATLPGVASVSAVRELPGHERAQWEARMDDDSSGAPVVVKTLLGEASEQKSSYLVVQHVTPRSPVLFVDVSGSATYAATIHAALGGNSVVVSERTALLEAPDGAPGYIACLRVNDTDGGVDPWGVLTFALRVDHLLQRRLSGLVAEPLRSMGIAVVDASSGTAEELFSSRSAAVHSNVIGEYGFPYAQRRLLLQVWAAEGYVQSGSVAAVEALASAGTLLTAGLATSVAAVAVIYILMRRQSVRQSLAAAEGAHTRVLSYVLHELRNPLHAVTGYVSLAAELIQAHDFPDGREVKATLIAALESSEQMKSVLDDVLDMQSLRSGAFVIRPRNSSPASILRDVRLQFTALCGESVPLRMEVDPSLPRVVRIDPARVRQIVFNAMHYAYNASPAKSGITLACTSVNSPLKEGRQRMWLAIAVAGTRGPFPPDVAKWAKHRYREACSSLTPSTLSEMEQWVVTSMVTNVASPMAASSSPSAMLSPGAIEWTSVADTKRPQLSFQLCDHIAAQMGGFVVLKHYAAYHKAVFMLLLPLETPTRVDSFRSLPILNRSEVAVDFRESVGVDAKVASKRHDSVFNHVLFVDDEPIMRRLGKRMCERAGASVTLCEDGADVAAALKEHPSVEIILMDIVMHRSDGRGVCRALRADGIDIPIVAVTANATPDMVAEYQRCGFNAMLAKPYGEAEIRSLLEHLRDNPGCWWTK